MNQDHQAGFDPSDKEILSQIVPEDDVFVEKADNSLPETPASPAPAPQTAPVASIEAEKPAESTPEVSAEAPKGEPRAALRAARRAEQRLRGEVDRLHQEIEQLKQGSNAPVMDTSVTDAELAELDIDFPLQAKVVRRQRALEEQLNQTRAASAPTAQPEFEPNSYDSAVQDVIDEVPELQAWQYNAAEQVKFQRAIDYDRALQMDPDWQGKPLAERFTEAVRRTNAALKPATTPVSAAPGTPRKNPADVIANLPVEGPKGISDFRGGAPSTAPTTNYANMSDEAIMASLPVS